MTHTKITDAYAGPASEISPGVEGDLIVATAESGEVFILRDEKTGTPRIFRFSGVAAPLAESIKTKGYIDEVHWWYWRTIYGSDAYLEEEALACMEAKLLPEDQWSDTMRELM